VQWNKRLTRQALQQYSSLESDLRAKEERRKYLVKRLEEMKERIDQAQQKIERMEKIAKLLK
jgi:phage shock protein A